MAIWHDVHVLALLGPIRAFWGVGEGFLHVTVYVVPMHSIIITLIIVRAYFPHAYNLVRLVLNCLVSCDSYALRILFGSML